MKSIVAFLPSLAVIALAAVACWALSRAITARARERGEEPGFGIQLSLPLVAVVALIGWQQMRPNAGGPRVPFRGPKAAAPLKL